MVDLQKEQFTKTFEVNILIFMVDTHAIIIMIHLFIIGLK